MATCPMGGQKRSGAHKDCQFENQGWGKQVDDHPPNKILMERIEGKRYHNHNRRHKRGRPLHRQVVKRSTSIGRPKQKTLWMNTLANIHHVETESFMKSETADILRRPHMRSADRTSLQNARTKSVTQTCRERETWKPISQCSKPQEECAAFKQPVCLCQWQRASKLVCNRCCCTH